MLLFRMISGTLLLCISLAAQGQVFQGLPFIRTFTTNEYQAGIQNWDIAQDPRGILYFANNFGLLEYDGHFWQTYPVKHGYKVRCLSIGVDGRIFAGAQGEFGYFSPQKNGQWQYTSLSEQLPEAEKDFGETWRAYQLDGKVYFCTFNKLFVYDGETIQTISPPNPLEFSFMANKRLYVLDWEQGLTVLEGSELVPLAGGNQFRHKRIVSILPYDQQQLLIVTQKHGLFLYDGLQFTAVPSLDERFSAPLYLNCAIRLQDGTFAIGSQSNGLFLLNHKLELQQQLDRPQGLNDHTVLSLYEDRHTNLWVGHNNGLSYVELSSPFTLLDEKLSIPGSGYAALLHHDTLYLGTNNGLYAGTRQGERLQFRKVENSEGQVYHISRQGNEVLMGHHNGAFSIQDGQAQALSQRTGVWQFMRLGNAPHLMLEGTYSGFSLYTRRQGKWQWQAKLPDFDESSRIFEEDLEGNIWMSHGYKGVYKLQLNKQMNAFKHIRFYGKDDGLPSNVLNNVYKLGSQLVVTGETGVYRYQPEADRFRIDSSLTNILGPSIHIQKLRQDGNGKIYFISTNKLGSIQQDEFGRWEADTSRFFKVLNLLNDDLDYLSVLDYQNVIFGAKEGFIHFNPTKSPPPQVPLQVFIRKVENNAPPHDSLLFAGNLLNTSSLAEKQPLEGRMLLSYTRNAVRFSYAAPYFDGNSQISYQYRLDHFDQDWSSWSRQTFKEYTNLPEGSYTFKVRARNIYGELSPEAVYHFEVGPPWYRSPLAYLGYAVFLGSIFFFGIFTVDRKHKRERELLTLEQQKKLEQKKIELNSLSKKSESEIARLKNEKLESEIRHQNKELATSTMHIVNKNEFIAEIKHHINSIIKDNDGKSAHKELKRIVKEIDQNIANDKDWEQFQIHFDRVHGDFSKRLRAAYPSLTPQEMKLCAYLRLNLSTKEIAQLMHISVRGVEISRYRLRKKLGLDRQENLLDFILSF